MSNGTTPRARTTWEIGRELEPLRRARSGNVSILNALTDTVAEFGSAKVTIEGLIERAERMEHRVRNGVGILSERSFAGSRRRRVENYLTEAGRQMASQIRAHRITETAIGVRVDHANEAIEIINNRIAELDIQIAELEAEMSAAPRMPMR